MATEDFELYPRGLDPLEYLQKHSPTAVDIDILRRVRFISAESNAGTTGIIVMVVPEIVPEVSHDASEAA